MPARVAPAAAVTPGTVLPPARIREWSKPTFGEWLDRISDPQAPLVGGILLAGILVLVWLVVQQVRRNVGAIPLYSRSAPVTEPRFTGGGPITSEPLKPASRLPGGPPHLSLQLKKASEPSVRPSPPFEELAIAMPEALRDKEEISVPESAAITEHEVTVADRGHPFEECLPIGKNIIEKSPSIAERIQPYEEPVGQGQPIPYQIPAFMVEPLMSEITQPTPESAPVCVEPEVAAEAAIVGRGGSQASIESPSFAPKIISTEPLAHQPTTPATVREPTPNHTNSTN